MEYLTTEYKKEFEEILITDTNLQFRRVNPNLSTGFEIKISDNLRKLFGIADGRIFPSQNFSHSLIIIDVPIVKPSVIPDTSQLIHTPYVKQNQYQIHGDDMFYLKFEMDQYWTLNMLARAFDAITKELKPTADLKSISIETTIPQMTIQTKTIVSKEKHNQIVFSQSIADVLNLEQTHFDLISGKLATYLFENVGSYCYKSSMV